MDLEVIIQELDSLVRCIHRVKSSCPNTLVELQKNIDAQDIVTLNLTRAVQLTVDIGSHIAANTPNPAPATMGESFELLNQLGVIEAGLASRLKKAVGFRNIAVNNYEVINWDVVYHIVTERLVDFTDFVSAINSGLKTRST